MENNDSDTKFWSDLSSSKMWRPGDATAVVKFDFCKGSLVGENWSTIMIWKFETHRCGLGAATAKHQAPLLDMGLLHMLLHMLLQMLE